MIIKRTTYKDMLRQSKLVPELEDEVKRLASLITSETKDCKMGVWCKECKHLGHDESTVSEFSNWYWEDVVAIGGEVFFCKKHLHEICPKFEERRK